MKKRLTKQLLTLLLFMMGAVAVNAQQKLKFSVASFELDPFDLTAKNDAYKKVDGNGSLYAIIKVTSTNPDDDLKTYNFNFGNMNSQVEQHDGELWVYVQRNAKMVTITRSGYTAINRYDLHTTIEEGRTYTMQLSSQSPMVYTQMVQFNIQPEGTGATITVKSSKAGAVKESLGVVDDFGSLARSLEYGTYTYEVIAPNYHPSEGRFTLKDKNQTHVETVTLRPNFSKMTLKVDADADIYVNGERKGRRTWTGILKAGNYQVECRQQNHRPSNQTINVVENDNRTIELLPPTPITGTLAITSRPLGANIKIDGKDYGITPQNLNDILIGRHTVTISRTNYKPETKSVEIMENQTTNIDVTLSDMAKMTIDSRPSHATLYIDGTNVGTTPYTAEMGSGDYNLRLTRYGYRDFEKKVHLDSSHPNFTLSLDKQYQKPTAFYVQAGMQVGSLMGVEATIGCYISNFNIEGTFLYGLDKSEKIHWNGTIGKTTNIYSANAYGGKVGYSVILGTRWRITPQGGLLCVSIHKDSSNSKSYVLSGTIGARTDVIVTSGLGFFAAPEMAFAIKKSDTYNMLEPVSTKIKGWGSGFNVRLGISLTL